MPFTTLNVVGGAFQLLGTAILFLDLKGDKSAEQAAEVRRYMEQLDLDIDELSREAKTRGQVTKEGIDIGQAFEIMEEGSRLAQRKNHKLHMELMDQISSHTERHRRVAQMAVVLVLVGTSMQLWSASLDA